jgi:CRISPR-associated protein Cst1
MNNNTIILYPSNWLYNAGVIGLLRVLESASASKFELLADDGTIEGNNLIDSVKRTVTTKNTTPLPKPLDELSAWHWNYTSLSFEWNYGSVKNFVRQNLERARQVSNRTKLRDQLTCKGFAYGTSSVDFGNINQHITDIFAKAFGRNPTLTVDQAANEIVNMIDQNKHAYIYRKSIGYLFSKGGFYSNLFNPSWFKDLRKFIEFFGEQSIFRKSNSRSKCVFCSGSNFELEPIDAEQMSFLFPVFSQFPNAYWRNDEKAVTQICSFCRFIILHQHLSLSRLSDGSEIFINAPSFRVMYEMNKLAKELYGTSSAEETRSKRETLAMSVIEYVTRIRATLGVWTAMNLEIVSRKGSEIEFFSLPYEVIQLISDREIAAQLSEIGEFKILDLVLKQEYSKLPEVGYRLLRIALANERGKQDRDFINDWLYLDRNKQKQIDLQHFADKILHLYALIEQKQQRSASYGHTSIARTYAR